nr:MAG TPA: hypothetical protein [Caudoviricetes sp.]
MILNWMDLMPALDLSTNTTLQRIVRLGML